MSRILLYAPVHPGDRGGVQAVFIRLADYLRGRGHAVSKAWGLPGTRAPKGDTSWTLPLLVWRRGLPAPRSTLQAGGALLRSAAHLLRDRPEVVNVHFVTPEALYFLLFRRAFGYRLVLSVHGSDVLRAAGGDAARLKRVLSRADGLTAVSAVTGAKVAELAGVHLARVRVIPNGIDYAFWSAGAPDGGELMARPPAVLSVGRLDPVKGHDLLLRAFALVAGGVAGARLVVVGGGGGRERLERLARELGIGDGVEFTGELDAQGIRARMAEARCFALPSRSEGWPLAPLEAMAAGLPLVATRVGGVPEIVEAGTGLLVQPEDADGMAEALRSVLLDGQLAARLSGNGKRRARAFEAAASCAAYEEVLLPAQAGR